MLRPIGFVIIALCLGTPNVHATDAKRHALLIGIQKYDDAKFGAVEYAERDITELASVLEKAGFSVTLLTQGTGKKDEALEPIKVNIEKSLETILAKAKKDDLVLVAFAGHGVRLVGKPEAYLCPRDARTQADSAQTLVSVEFLCEKLGSCSAANKVLLVDACRGDPKSDVAFQGDKVKVPASVFAMFSCSSGERSLSRKDIEHGIFFHLVIEGLRGKAGDGNDAITFTSLAEFVFQEAPKEGKKFNDDAKQTPSIHKGDATVSPLLAMHQDAIPVEEWKEYESVWSKGSTEPFLKKFAPKRYAAWRKSAEAGSARGMMLVADCAEFGVGGKIDAKESALWYGNGAKRGNTFAMIGFGLCYQKGFGVEKDVDEAARWIRKSAELGDPGGMELLGTCYMDGRGVEKDVKEAYRWYRKSAELGFGQAMYALATCYLSGSGIEKDEEEAFNWFRKGAGLGNIPSMIYVGICYRDGLGISENEKEAVNWFRKAAAEGSADAMNLLGRCYLDGTGVEKEEKAGAAWFRKSAELDNATGMLNLGVCYKLGTGVTKSRAEAATWLRKAAEKGSDEAKQLLKDLFD